MVQSSNNFSVSTIDGQNIGARQPEPPPIGFIPPNVNPPQLGPPPPLYELPPPYNPSYEPTRPTTQQVRPPTVTMWRQPNDRNLRKKKIIVLVMIVFSVLVGIGIITTFFVLKNAAWHSFHESLHSTDERWFQNY